MMLSPALDFFPLMAALLAAVCCGLLGSFLVLRGLSLMGDAMSHSVLPGLVIAFMLTGARSAPVMFAGAAMAGIATVVLVEVVKRLGRVEPGAAMGVVFSVLFALGVLLIERAARNTDLDADCVLHGQLETLVWDGPAAWSDLRIGAVLEAAPPPIYTLAITCIVAILFVAALYKELRIAAFDPALATAQGFRASVLHYALMVLVAAAVVASFEAVGSILVIALLIVPAATARLLTDRYLTQVLLAPAIALVAAVLGYLSSFTVPGWFGKAEINAAGSMTVMLGLAVTLAAILGPRYGVLSAIRRRRRLRRTIEIDDLLGKLYRHEESRAPLPTGAIPGLRHAIGQKLVVREGDEVRLTEEGRRRAESVIRRHRLWEAYLVERAGISPDHVHESAEWLEHVRQVPSDRAVSTDPHGRPIPPEQS